MHSDGFRGGEGGTEIKLTELIFLKYVRLFNTDSRGEFLKSKGREK